MLFRSIRQLVSQTISDPEDGDRLAQILIARRDWIGDHWSTGKYVEHPADTSKSDASAAKAKPFMSEKDFASSKPSSAVTRSRGRGFASSSGMGDNPDDETGGGRVIGRGLGQAVPGGALEGGRGTTTSKQKVRDPEGIGGKWEGKTFEEIKPDNWDELTLDEKWNWALKEGNPANGSKMSTVEYRKLLSDLEKQDDEEWLASLTPEERKAEMASRRAERRASDVASRRVPEEGEKKKVQRTSSDIDDAESIPKAKIKKSKTAKEAEDERSTRLDNLIEKMDVVRSSNDDDNSVDDAHRTIWDDVSEAIQTSGKYDFSIETLDSATQKLDDYI